ncbi:MAG: ABC transporter permease [Deltaproteobacteria bacterium]|nr:ABC transporter permease [Deltaproteobacteria bacterium]
MKNLTKSILSQIKSLRRTPTLSLAAILTLAVGIGAATAVFSVLYGVLLKPLPYENPDRLVGVWHTAPGLGWDRVNQSPALYFTYREKSQSFTDTGMWDNGTASVTGLAEPEEVEVIRVTDGIFPLLGSVPLLGRPFSQVDDSQAGAETVILSHHYWRDRFGSDPEAVGKTLLVDGKPREIIAVMSPELHFLDYDPALYLPFRFDRNEIFFGNFSYQGIARLRPGVSVEKANSEMAQLILVALDSFPLPPGFSKGMLEEVQFAPSLHPLKEDVVGDVGKVLWVLLGTVGLVLLVACANVANLLLVKAEGRQQELAVRRALGAGRGRLGRQLLSESLTLGILGGMGGVILAYGGLKLLVALAPQGLPRIGELAINSQILAFALGISALSALAFGSVPLLRLGSSGDLVNALKEGGRSASTGQKGHRARNLLVTSQIALALVLIIGSGLMVRSYQALQQVRPGFENPEKVQTLSLSIPEAEVEDQAEVARLYETMLESLTALPGVTSAGLSTSVTMSGNNSMDPVFLEDFPTVADQVPPLRRFKWISPQYFETMGNPLRAGRSLHWQDIRDRAPVAVVSENFAKEYWGDSAAAIGSRIRNNPSSPWREIVGVVGDVRDDGPAREAPTVIFWPMAMEDFWEPGLRVSRSLTFVLRSPRVGSESLMQEVRAAIWEINPRLPLADVRTLEEIFQSSMARTSFTLTMLLIAAATALLLGGIGIYGVTSYITSQRTREIGVRMAFGARPGDVSRLVLRRGVVMAATGIGIGLVIALALTRVMSSLLYGVQPVDAVTYGLGGLAVATIALLACYLPARRAASINPIQALRWR